MKQLPKPRALAIGMLAALMMLTAGFSFAAAAQGQPTLSVMTAGGTAKCEQVNQDRPVVTRGDEFAISVHGLSANEAVAISFTFPDGRVYSPAVTQPGGADALDGITQQIDDPGFFGQTNVGGDYDAFFATTDAWPRGCYKITAQGIAGSLQASGYLVLKDAPLPAPEAGPLGLEVRSHTGLQSSGAQGVTVDIYGRRFMSGEVVQLRMIQPDGTIIELPSPPVSTVGSFQTAVTLGGNRLVGDYTFVATSGNGHSQQATFKLTPQTFTPLGVALLNISSPSPAVPVQGGTIQLQGRLFAAGESVSIRLVQADGIVRTLANVQANQLGEFTVDLTLNHQTPIKAHKLVASSTTALKSIEFQLNVGPGLVPPVTEVSPIMVGTAGSGAGSGADGSTFINPSAPAPAAPSPSAPAPAPAATGTADPTVTAATKDTATPATPSVIATPPATASATTVGLPSALPDTSVAPMMATPCLCEPAPNASPLIPIDPPAEPAADLVAPVVVPTPAF